MPRRRRQLLAHREFRRSPPPAARLSACQFRDAPGFNADVSKWDAASVTNFRDMFNEVTSFNQPGISAWDVSAATDMGFMFWNTALLSDGCGKLQVYLAWQGVAAFTTAYDWTTAVCPGVFIDGASLKAAVADVTTAEATHGPISGWDVSRVDDMTELLDIDGASTFNEAIGAWAVSYTHLTLPTKA